MTNICTPYNYQGLAANCVAMLKKVKAVIMTDKGVTSSPLDFIALDANKLIVAAAAGATGIVLDFSRGYERTTDDSEVTTSNLNFKEKTMDSLPSLKGFAKISMCDYKTLFAADGQSFDFRLFLNDGMLMGTNQAYGTYKGFRGRINVRFDLPVSDNAQTSYPVDIFFDDIDEFKDFAIAKSAFKISELVDSVPAAIDISLNTAYAAGVVKLDSTKRCSAEVYSGFAAAAQWSVIESNASDVTVTLASVANGVNSITIQKDSGTTPADLASGEYAIIQGILDDATYITYISNYYKVEA